MKRDRLRRNVSMLPLPVAVFAVTAGVLLVAQVSVRVHSTASSVTGVIEERLVRDRTDVDVVASAIEGMSDVSMSEFRIAVSAILEEVGAVEALMLSLADAEPLGLADGVFAAPGGAAGAPGQLVIQRVEPWTPENVAALGRSLSDVVVPRDGQGSQQHVPLRQYGNAGEAFARWFGDALFVKRAIRVVPSVGLNGENAVLPANVRGYLVARINPAAEAAAVSTDRARAIVGPAGTVFERSASWRINVPLAFSEMPIAGVLDASVLPMHRETVVAVFISSGTAMLAAMSATSLSSRRRKMDTLRKRLEIATSCGGIGIWDWDMRTGSVVFSDTAFIMLGYDQGELASTIETWETLVHPDDIADAKVAMGRHIDGMTATSTHEQRLRRKDGTWLWVRNVCEVVGRDEQGTPTRMIGVYVEIQDLRRALDDAHAASRAKSDFLANMSHEIRTPMTAILGYADLLEGDDGDPAQAEDAVKTIRTNAHHLLAIINDILDVSKIEAGRMTVESIETDAVQIVQEVVELVAPRAASKGIQVEAIFGARIPRVFLSDPTRLRQILLNLAGNAVKFTERGTIRIAAEYDESAWQMRFHVIDTGVGMTPEQLATTRKFGAFAQADETMSRKFGGTGLGLRISHAFAVMLGGQLEVESQHGKGSRFTATIGTGDPSELELIDGRRSTCQRPTSREEAVDGRAAGTGRPLAGRRVLLAEDGRDNQRLISFHLRKAGAEVTICENGLVAVEHIERARADQQPHVILMDMQMPELDGYAATRRLRAAGVTTPIVALTAHAMVGDRQKCINAGCDEYLTKPIDKQRLISTCANASSSVSAKRRAA